MRHRLLYLLLCWPFAATAQEHVLTLQRAIEQALHDSPQVNASVATLEGAQAVAPSAGRLPDPELVVGVDNLPVDTPDRFSFTNDFMTMRKIGVMQSSRAARSGVCRASEPSARSALRKASFARAEFETSLAVRRRGSRAPWPSSHSHTRDTLA
jgi:hypothetical protein